jgi:hypothetical protein
VAYDYAATGSTPKTLYSLISPRNSNEQFFSDGNLIATAARGLEIALGTRLDGEVVPISWVLGLAYFDREGFNNQSGAVSLVPAPYPGSRWRGAVSVDALLNSGQSALSAVVTRDTLYSGMFTNGWYQVDTLVPQSSLGLPVLGASFIKLTNPAAQPGVSGNYGITWPHSYIR